MPNNTPVFPEQLFGAPIWQFSRQKIWRKVGVPVIVMGMWVITLAMMMVIRGMTGALWRQK